MSSHTVYSGEPHGVARCAVHAETIEEQLERLNPMLTGFITGQIENKCTAEFGVDNPFDAVLIAVPAPITISRNGITL